LLCPRANPRPGYPTGQELGHLPDAEQCCPAETRAAECAARLKGVFERISPSVARLELLDISPYIYAGLPEIAYDVVDEGRILASVAHQL